jgi:hypothetical protein
MWQRVYLVIGHGRCDRLPSAEGLASAERCGSVHREMAAANEGLTDLLEDEGPSCPLEDLQ